jgi:ABC-2 type transport system ATP-binding protein
MSTIDDIALLDVSKTFVGAWFRKKTAVRDLTLTVPRGEVVGLLGPNGSGKSTTLKMVVGFLKPTSGHVLLFGEPAEKPSSRRRLGYLPENPRFQRFMTGRAQLLYLGGLHGLSAAERARRADELFTLVDLRDAADERVGGYSKGMTQRLAIAQALLARPDLLILDEPMSGLDPIGRLEVRSLIARIHRESPRTTIFFSSHVLSDVESLCSHVVLLRGGTLLKSCSMRELLGEQPSEYEVQIERKEGPLPAELECWTPRSTVRGTILVAPDARGLETILSTLAKTGDTILNVQSRRRTLEDTLFRDRGAA